LFEAAARLAPREPELLADLALCQHRLGNDELARQTNLDAVARASEPTQLEDPHFARIRRHIYFNLAALEPLPESSLDTDAGCWQFQAVPGCSKSLNACGVSRAAGGQTYRSTAFVIRVAESKEAAGIADGEGDGGGDAEQLATPSPELPISVDRDQTFDFLGSFSEEQLSYPCEWTCEGSSAVAEAVSKCQSSPKRSTAASEDCQRSVCKRAESSPWAAIEAERRAEDACYADAAKVNAEYQCGVVYANACSGLVGLICSGHAGGEEQTRTRIEEYRFRAAADESSSSASAFLSGK
jgi:hypothetical protein